MKSTDITTQSNTPEECREFQQQLPELFDSDADLHGNAHLKTCSNCTSLVQDLEYIAQQAKLLLPIHDPSPAVWQNIQNAVARKSSNNGSGSNN